MAEAGYSYPGRECIFPKNLFSSASVSVWRAALALLDRPFCRAVRHQRITAAPKAWERAKDSASKLFIYNVLSAIIYSRILAM